MADLLAVPKVDRPSSSLSSNTEVKRRSSVDDRKVTGKTGKRGESIRLEELYPENGSLSSWARQRRRSSATKYPAGVFHAPRESQEKQIVPSNLDTINKESDKLSFVPRRMSVSSQSPGGGLGLNFRRRSIKKRHSIVKELETTTQKSKETASPADTRRASRIDIDDLGAPLTDTGNTTRAIRESSEKAKMMLEVMMEAYHKRKEIEDQRISNLNAISNEIQAMKADIEALEAACSPICTEKLNRDYDEHMKKMKQRSRCVAVPRDPIPERVRFHRFSLS